MNILFCYSIYLVTTDVDLDRGDNSHNTGYHIDFFADGVEWEGEIIKDSNEYYVEWFSGVKSPKNYESINKLVNDNFATIRRDAPIKDVM